MDMQANITLAAINGSHSPSIRVLHLSPNRRVVQIGRASKNSSKGLLEASDNGWFDSPVMSRNHAEISLNLNNNAITIEDIGSMHGTYVNHDQLKKKEARGLSDGDIVVFGAEVKRGEETFPACAFKITYEILPYKTSQTNTFAYPESSDIEDEEDFEFSDDLGENDGPSSEDEMSIESQPLKASQSINAIDLTRDDSPIVSAAVENDSILNNPIEERVIGFVSGTIANINQDTTPTSLSVDARNATIIVDSEDENESLSFDSDNQSEDAEVDESGLRSPYDSEEVADSEDSECIEVQPVELATKPILDNKHAGDAPTFGLDIFGIDENKTGISVKTLIEVPEQILGRDNDDDDCDDEDYDSDFGLSQAGREGLQRLRDDGLLDNFADDHFVKAGKNVVVVGPETLTSGETCKESKEANLAGICWETAEVDFNVFDAKNNGSVLKEAHTLSYTNLRQPSPSDAAMVKSMASSTGFGVSVNHLPSGEWRRHISQTLGEKTGKHAFFEARDHNRTAVQAKQLDKVSFTTSSYQSTVPTPSHTYEELKRQRDTEAAASKIEERQRIILGEPTPTDVARGLIDLTKSLGTSSDTGSLTATSNSAPGSLSFLDDHSQIPPAQRTPGPEPDMTSAVKYNESRAAIAAANETSAVFLGRSGLSINDIIDDATTEHTSRNMKRKADDISDVIENEVREWASSLPSNSSGGSTNTTVSTTQATASQDLSGINSSPMNEQRPTKKIRRFVERLGYAAVGGAAVGATLFFGLVATAPDFL